MANVSGRKDELQGQIVHEYDGIEEADNQLPRWWLAVFIGTVGFGLAYWLGFEVYGLSQTPKQEYAAELLAIEQARAVAAANAPETTDESLLALAASPEVVAAGAALFHQNCVACHGEQAEGKIGPNLTDGFWIHGGAAIEIHKTVTEGVAAKGMPAWGPVLGPKAVREAVAFVLSRRGQDVPGKPAEGTPYVAAK